ncbi:hypothetical protein AAC03nite_31870 [Alicyclobacillus acidoterrestris]|uniref:hypothetical protein n=1 Tax=Alicyclobacillus suci TaxID=2816080 RepID=UPI0011968C58|nr:hypothetical protein [Alicyclobacillus suci]GEO27402.1 hypothetical protein AAC03nite_31870 [Alicyclobacillus acidoterrestris]
MRWAEVRELFPDKFVVLENLKSHTQDGHLHVEKVAVIRPLADGKEAVKGMRNCTGDRFIYHTSKDAIEMPIRPMPNLLSNIQ